jgi:taurine dioxygenase
MDVQSQAIGPANVYSHAWQKGDLVLWDNRCLLHRALVHADMGLHPRVLHRTVVKGSVPY